MTYSIRIKKSEVKKIAPKPRHIWVSKENPSEYVKQKDRGIWETYEEACAEKSYAEEILANADCYD
jgi:hypothetical protein